MIWTVVFNHNASSTGRQSNGPFSKGNQGGPGQLSRGVEVSRRSRGEERCGSKIAGQGAVKVRPASFQGNHPCAYRNNLTSDQHHHGTRLRAGRLSA